MLNYKFLLTPSSDQIRHIISLYRTAGWWSKDIPDDPHLVERIIAGSHCFIVATEGEEIVGMGRAISDRASDAYIQDLTVKETYREMGVGTEIVNRILSRLEKDGIKWIALIAEKNSHKFYEHLGYKIMPDSTPMIKILT
jgi:aralkylamine N-acetyltransferase